MSESTTAEVLTPATTSEPSTQAWKYYAKIETALEYADNIIEALPVAQAGLQQCLRYPTTQNQWEETDYVICLIQQGDSGLTYWMNQFDAELALFSEQKSAATEFAPPACINALNKVAALNDRHQDLLDEIGNPRAKLDAQLTQNQKLNDEHLSALLQAQTSCQAILREG